MNSIHGLVLRVAALVVGSAVVVAGIASNPATAQGVNSMIQELANTVCSKSAPCTKFTNNGSGAGIEGVGGSGNGVIAKSTNGSAILSTSTNGNAIQAYSTNFDATNSGTNNNSTTHPGRSGVYGHDDSIDGGTKNVGVFGLTTNGTGIEGVSTNGDGVLGFTTGGNGIEGQASIGAGVYGFSTSGNGGAFQNNGNAIALLAISDSTAGSPFEAYGPDGIVFEDSSGDLSASGSMYATSFIVVTDAITGDGRHVTSYASRSADAEMSDVGTGSIVAGRGIVRLDPAFVRTLDARSGYHVFLTPKGDSKGLYIASESPASFEVRESQGGQSTLSFDYRIIGRAADVKSGRLPAIRLSAPAIPRGLPPPHIHL